MYRAHPISRILVALLVVFAAGASGSEQTEPSTGELARHLLLPIFDLLDCTDQGYIEAGEVDEHFPSLFGYHDKNRDFRLSRREYLSRVDDAKARLDLLLFKRMDEDKDDSVTTFEYRGEVMSLIRSMDADGDGETTLEELSQQDPR